MNKEPARNVDAIIAANQPELDQMWQQRQAENAAAITPEIPPANPGEREQRHNIANSPLLNSLAVAAFSDTRPNVDVQNPDPKPVTESVLASIADAQARIAARAFPTHLRRNRP